MYAQYTPKEGAEVLDPEWSTVSREGYTFAGWWDSKDDTGKQVSAEDKAPTDKVETIYAHWTKEGAATKLTLDGNGTDISAVKDLPTEFKEGEKVTLPDVSSAAPTGKTFKGWTPNLDEKDEAGLPKTILTAGTEVDLTEYIKDGAVTLYAVWADDASSNTNNENSNVNNENANTNSNTGSNANNSNYTTNITSNANNVPAAGDQRVVSSGGEISKTADTRGMTIAVIALSAAGVAIVLALGRRRSLR